VPSTDTRAHRRHCPGAPAAPPLPAAPSPAPLAPLPPPRTASPSTVSCIDPSGLCPAADGGAFFDGVADTLGIDLSAISDDRDIHDWQAQAAADRYTPDICDLWPQERADSPSPPPTARASLSAGMLAAVRALDAELEHGFDLAAHARSSRAAGDGCADLMRLDNAPSKKRRSHKRRKRNPYVDDEASASGSGGSSGGEDIGGEASASGSGGSSGGEGGYDTNGAIGAIGGSSGGEDGYDTSGVIDAIDDYFDG